MRIFATHSESLLMRSSLLLFPLGMLLLSSCEPDVVNSADANGRHRKPADGLGESIPADELSRAQISAQESLGKPPLPRNLASATADICPVHHEKMRLREIPIVFEEATSEGTASASATLTAAFPFGAEKIVSAANSLLPGEPHSARVYQCISCIAARHAAEEKRTPATPE